MRRTRCKVLVPSDQPPQEQYTEHHPHVICDVCDQSLGSAPRYMCLDCLDYDLCSNCEGNDLIFFGHFQGTHNFAKIRNSNMNRERIEGYRMQLRAEEGVRTPAQDNFYMRRD
eukprot:TRINITY_DN3652_c0_g1_i1.p1 TRINITY_DN3652_c0_g1~~TRINITY_DN3652_c0_g1_i1.p1  ORF type:complete len:113 (-),score=14.64 TRINITY_DN3652_c0_g1_i1:63-401(-)